MEYDEIVDMVVDELTERGFQQQRKEDEQVDQLIKRRIELKEQVRSCTAGLDENAKKGAGGLPRNYRGNLRFSG